MMKIFKPLLFLVSLVLFLSCQSANEKAGQFWLLPVPQQFEITGTSSISVKNVSNYFALNGEQLPVRSLMLEGIQPSEKQSEAHIVFSIDESLDLRAEGYELEISKTQVSMFGKDEAGLMYGFMTLEQLMEDALTRIRNLPEDFKVMQEQMEEVYGKIRILSKPEGYLLDQDHHSHLANQSISFNWQFIAELLFLEKVEMNLVNR